MKPWLIEHKKPLAVVAAILFLLIGAWQIFSQQIAKTFQDSLLQRINQQLNGRLQVGTVDLSALGWIRVRDVTLYSQQGEMLGRSPLVKIGYRWSDLASRSFGLSLVETVALEEAELWLKERDSRLNWADLLKGDSAEATDFRGKVELAKSKIHMETALFAKVMEQVNGGVDFKANPDLAINVSGKIEQSPVTVAGIWGKGRPGEFTVQAGQLDLVKLGVSLGHGADTRLEKGILDTLKLTVKIEASGAVRYGVQGAVSGIATGGKIEIREGRGKFSGDQDGLQFQEIAMVAAGQQAQGQGTLRWQNGKGIMDFAILLPDVDPNMVVSGLPVQRPLAIQLQVTGVAPDPEITGSFRAPQVNFSDMAVATVSGRFRHLGDRVLLEQVGGATYNGSLAAAGEVRIADESYELDVEGQSMDSSRLTDKDVQGPMDFSGHTSGKGQEAVTRGSFVIHKGKAYGISFDRMTGQFVKRGASTEISGLAVQTALGTFYPEQLSREALERINRQELPVTREELKKTVTDKLIQRIIR